MDDKILLFDHAAFLDEQRKDTALQLSALGDRVARGELAGVWAVAMPLEGAAEVVGLSESRVDDLAQILSRLAGELELPPDEGDDEGDETEEPVADKNLSFSSALVAAKAGLTIRREGWNGAGLNVRLHRPRQGRDEATTVPFFVIVNPPTHPTAPNLRASWVPSQTDMLAEDWLVVPGVIYA